MLGSPGPVFPASELVIWACWQLRNLIITLCPSWIVAGTLVQKGCRDKNTHFSAGNVLIAAISQER